MGIDLTGLDLDMDPQEAAAAASGEPLRLKLSDVLEDPNQPRKEFPQDSMDEMVASVKERGVKTPISVKPHPTLPGKYLLNYGARRYRASVALGLDSIPAIIDTDHNDYDQVIENLQRENLTALELATFIERKVKDGEKPSAIAKKLGKKPSMVSEHMALIDAPSLIMDLYLEGRCTSARAIYDLRSLYEKYPDQVAAFVAEHAGDIGQRQVAGLSSQLKGGKTVVKVAPPAPASGEGSQAGDGKGGAESTTAAPPQSPTFRDNEKSGDAPEREDGAEAGAGRSNTEGSAPVHKVLAHNPANEKALNKAPEKGDPQRLKKPVMIVEYDGRAAMVLIFNRPSSAGLLWIKYEDNGEEVQVDAGRCRINNLQDASA